MKVIITGSRSFEDDQLKAIRWIRSSIRRLTKIGPITEVVSGKTLGIDLLGEKWAEQRNIPVAWFSADWDKHGKSAKPIRNQEMTNYADALIAIWDGKSKDTTDMVNKAMKQGLVVVLVDTRLLEDMHT